MLTCGKASSKNSMMGKLCVSTTVCPVAKSRTSSVGTCVWGFKAAYLLCRVKKRSNQ